MFNDPRDEETAKAFYSGVEELLEKLDPRFLFLLFFVEIGMIGEKIDNDCEADGDGDGKFVEAIWYKEPCP